MVNNQIYVSKHVHFWLIWRCTQTLSAKYKTKLAFRAQLWTWTSLWRRRRPLNCCSWVAAAAAEQAEHFRSQRCCSKVYRDSTCARPCCTASLLLGADISEVTSRQSLRGDRWAKDLPVNPANHLYLDRTQHIRHRHKNGEKKWRKKERMKAKRTDWVKCVFQISNPTAVKQTPKISKQVRLRLIVCLLAPRQKSSLIPSSHRDDVGSCFQLNWIFRAGLWWGFEAACDWPLNGPDTQTRCSGSPPGFSSAGKIRIQNNTKHKYKYKYKTNANTNTSTNKNANTNTNTKQIQI